MPVRIESIQGRPDEAGDYMTVIVPLDADEAPFVEMINKDAVPKFHAGWFPGLMRSPLLDLPQHPPLYRARQHVPRPRNKYCQVCRTGFENLEEHVLEERHRRIVAFQARGFPQTTRGELAARLRDLAVKSDRTVQ
jgi:hypothetical protein